MGKNRELEQKSAHPGTHLCVSKRRAAAFNFCLPQLSATPLAAAQAFPHLRQVARGIRHHGELPAHEEECAPTCKSPVLGCKLY